MARSITQHISQHVLGMFVPPEHVALVLNNGSPHRLVGPGQAQLRSLLESFGPLIHVGPRPFQLSIDNLRSRDGIPFQVEVTGFYAFDPRLAVKGYALTLAYRYGFQPSLLEERVLFMVEQAVRAELGQYEAEVLCQGQTYQKGYAGKIIQATRQESLPEGIQIEKVATTIYPVPSYESLMQYTRMNREALEIHKEMEKIQALARANIQITHISMDENVRQFLSQIANSLAPIFPRAKLN